MHLRLLLVVAERDQLRLLQMVRDHGSELIVVGTAENAVSADRLITMHEPDLVLYDPRIDEGEWLVSWERTYQGVPVLVCVSEDPSYAVLAFEAGAAHYLVLGDDGAGLVLALERARRRLERRPFIDRLAIRERPVDYEPNVIALPVLSAVEVRRRDQIIRIQGEGNYSTVIFERDPALTLSRPIGEYEPLLASSGFLRVHRSHIVNLAHVRRVLRGKGARLFLSNGDVVDVSERYRQRLLEALNVVGRRNVRGIE
jgi:two-component system LytT family response regulator